MEHERASRDVVSGRLSYQIIALESVGDQLLYSVYFIIGFHTTCESCHATSVFLIFVKYCAEFILPFLEGVRCNVPGAVDTAVLTKVPPSSKMWFVTNMQFYFKKNGS